ncbi:MAG: class I SAM-dependent methyltransferase, partial [Thermoplasmata archaeon]
MITMILYQKNRRYLLLAALLVICVILILGNHLITTEKVDRKQPSIESYLAEYIIKKVEISRGICSVLGCNNLELAIELTQSSGLFMHILDPDIKEVATAKIDVDVNGQYGKRIVVEKGTFNRLPYADNTVDLVIAAHLKEHSLEEVSLAEILRVLRPNGKAVLGRSKKQEPFSDTPSIRQLENWLQSAHISDYRIIDDSYGLWALFIKPSLAGTDNWSHWGHGTDNNPVSTDTVISAPYMTQWLGIPFYLAMPAITTAAGGRTFLAMGHIAHHEREEKWLNTLIARNGYNGIELWSRKLPDGYLVHRSAFVATDDTFYMIDTSGNGCLLLDPETGVEKNRISIPGLSGDWKWIAFEEGILYALIGKEKDPPQTTLIRSQSTQWSWADLSQGYYERRLPWGFGTTILAYDISQKNVLWTHTEE